MSTLALVIDRDTVLRSSLGDRLKQAGYRVFFSDRPDEIQRLIRKKRIDVALLNLADMKRAGLALLSVIRNTEPWISVILINRPEQIALSIEGMDLGAFDDFLLPFIMNDLMARIREAVQQTRRRQPRSRNLRGRLDNLMIAVSFAEAGEPHTARYYLNRYNGQSPPGDKPDRTPNREGGH